MHAVLSPSSSARWMSCPASVMESKDLPDKSSVYADEGSLAHLVMASFGNGYINEGKSEDELIASIPAVLASSEAKRFNFTPTPEWINEVESCARVWLSELKKASLGFPDVAAFEVGVDLSEVLSTPGSFGTADCLMLVGDTLHVFDYKHGRGVPVSAEANSQLSLYALGALTDENTKHVTKVVLHIVQPRVYEGVNSYTWDRDALEEWGGAMRMVAQRAVALYEGAEPAEADYKVSPSNCQFCKAAGKCRAVTKQFGLVADLPNVLEVPDDPEKLSKILKFKPVAEKFLELAEQRAYDLLSEGKEVPGYKLVLGNPGNRKWTLSEKEMDVVLKNKKLKDGERFVFKIISPTQAQKLVKSGRLTERQWASLEELITRTPAKPTLVEESDKRPALSFNNDEYVEKIS